MATLKGRFTKAFINDLQPPTCGRVFVADTEETGLLLCVSATGKRVFQLRKKFQGKAVRVTLGDWPTLTVENARILARQAKTSMEFDGVNPNKKKRQQREAEARAKTEMSFADLFAMYMERHSRPNKRSWKDDELAYRNHLSVLGAKKVSAITRDDILAVHTRLAKTGHPAYGNRVLALISSIFGRAIEWGLLQENPCLGVRRHKEQARERFLSGDELHRLFSALEEEQNETARDFFLVALLTGARRANVLEMKWADIDFESAIWRIPHTKNGTPQSVPLVQDIIELLQRRITAKNKEKLLNPFVFPGHGKTLHFAEPKSAWKRICERAGIEGVRIHDLRRTFGSWQAITGASLPIIGKSLNHKSQSATAIYSRLDLDPVRASMEKAVQAMLEHKTAIVHSFPKKAVGE